MKKQRNKYKEKVRTKSAKTAISGIFEAFSAGKEFFLKIGLGHVLSIANAHLYGKNQKKTNDEISRKCQKTDFSGIFPAFSAGNEFFSGNRAPSHFGHNHFASLRQKSGKTNEPIQRKAGNERTDERTNGRTNGKTNGKRLIYLQVGPKSDP